MVYFQIILKQTKALVSRFVKFYLMWILKANFIHIYGDDIPTFEVRYELPFQCDDFSKSVVQYYQQVMGPQSTTISHSGPKGMNPSKNVFRAQWQVELTASKK